MLDFQGMNLKTILEADQPVMVHSRRAPGKPFPLGTPPPYWGTKGWPKVGEREYVRHDGRGDGVGWYVCVGYDRETGHPEWVRAPNGR